MNPLPLPHEVACPAAGWLLPVALPLLVALLYGVPPWRRALTWLGPWTALPGLVLSAVAPGGRGVVLSGALMGVHLGLTETTRIFLLFTSTLWLVGGLYAISYLRSDPRRHVFFIYFLLAMAGNIGLVLARDAVSFLSLFALMSFASYGLVVHSGTDEARKAGKVYIVLVVVGEMLLFPALLMAASHAQSLLLDDIAARLPGAAHLNLLVAMLLIGFGIKAGALPLHVWLPLAHPAAPVPASAVLSGCMIKAGLLGWMSFLPLGYVALPPWGMGLIAAGFIAAFFGLVAALLQDDAKTLLAYSSISKMGWMTIALGVGLASAKAWPAASMAICVYAMHHAWTKGALFLTTGAARLPVRTPWGAAGLWLGIMLPVLAFAGFPGSGGAAAKMVIKDLVYHAPGAWAPVLKCGLWWAGVFGVWVLARFVYLVRPRGERASASVPAVATAIPWAASVMLVALAPALMTMFGLDVAEARGYTLAALWTNLWPLLLAVLVAAVVGRSAWKPAWRLPAGDILGLYQRVLRALRAAWAPGARRVLAREQGSSLHLVLRGSRIVSAGDALGRGERRLRRWSTASALLLGLALLSGVVAWLAGG